MCRTSPFGDNVQIIVASTEQAIDHAVQVRSAQQAY
jgi:hypothetical protein